METLRKPFQPDWEGLIRNIRREATPERVFNIELFQDREIQDALCDRFGLLDNLDRAAPDFALRREIAANRFSGFDYVRVGIDGLDMNLARKVVEDTADLGRPGGRSYQDEHVGPIMSWDDFERYTWPDPDKLEATRRLEWYQENLPDDMCIIASGGFAHIAEMLNWLMGYETLCYALYDQRDLVQAISDRLLKLYSRTLELMLQFDRVKIVWASDDMGFKTGLLISPDDTREFILTPHKQLAALTHAAGRPYLLHACGNLTDIMRDLIDDVEVDAKHSFEDTIEDVRVVKRSYGREIALLGGIDVDFLCRATETEIRDRVRDTLEQCMPGGGYCLGTGNSVANYIPLESYLVMLDEGRRFRP